MWLKRLIPLDRRRQWLLDKLSQGPLHDFLSQSFPENEQDVSDCNFVSIDLETSGLDPNEDQILSIGLVEITHEVIELGTAQHWIIKTEQQLEEGNVAIHQLTDDMVAQGMSLAEAMSRLLPILKGKVLLAHHAQVETGFLSAACQRLYGAPLLIPVVDTLALAHRQLSRAHEVIAEGSLRLAALRERYHLPRYAAHHALTDALATAELFLALVAEKRGGQPQLPLKQVLSKN